MKNRKNCIVLLMALAICMSLLAPAAFAADEAFPDVSSANPYAKAINFLKGLSVLGGDENGNFNPEKTITRAEFSKIVYVLYNGTPDAPKAPSSFPDVAEGAWYNGYVNWAFEKKIIGGRDTGLFDPDAPVTVAEATKMFVVAVTGNSKLSWPDGFASSASLYGLYDFAEFESLNSPAARQLVAQIAYNAVFTTSILLNDFTPAEKFFGITLYTDEKILLGTYSANSSTYDVKNTADAVVMASEKYDLFLGELWAKSRPETVKSGVTYKSAGIDNPDLVGVPVLVIYTDSSKTTVMKLQALGNAVREYTGRITSSGGKYYIGDEELVLSADLFSAGRCLCMAISTFGKWFNFPEEVNGIVLNNRSDEGIVLCDADKDGVIDYIYLEYTMSGARIAAIDADKKTIAIDADFPPVGNSTWTTGTITVASVEGFEVGDFIDFTYAWSADKVRVHYLSKAKTTDTILTAVGENGSYTFGDKTYQTSTARVTISTAAESAVNFAKREDAAVEDLKAENIGSEFKLVFDTQGFIVRAIKK